MLFNLDIFGLRRWYKEILDKNFYKFLLALGLLAFAPLFTSIVFDYLILHDNGQLPSSVLFGFVLVLLLLLLIFISIALWAAIKSNVTGERRIVLIISAYLMIWLAFGNLYYFFSDIENFVLADKQSTETIMQLPAGNMQLAELQERTVLKNIPYFWELQAADSLTSDKQDLAPMSVNRINGYIDCLYFSGVSILTIGYGDIVPESRFLKMLVVLEGFLGQFINVVAIGLWLSTASKEK